MHPVAGLFIVLELMLFSYLILSFFIKTAGQAARMVFVYFAVIDGV